MGSTRVVRSAFILPLVATVAAAAPVGAQCVRVLDRAEYLERLEGFWLGQCIANWTGLQTEGHRIAPPFFTDADWGAAVPGFVTIFDPWPSDDDTDIEYVYLHLHTLHESQRLTPEQIHAGWVSHINRFIWASNAATREAIGRGVRPPATSIAQGLIHGSAWPVEQSLMIDAQLTTEFFGALCPGMPERALEMADLPIRATAHGHAALAAQVYVIMYSLAPTAPRGLSGADLTLWLHREARKFIPDDSKTADIMDFVLADYLSNPDHDDWERTRDLCHSRYCAPGPSNPGFVYRGWFESSINLATGLIALLYGEGDYRRTVQIGTLSGWDSDNGTATMGGLLGLLLGDAGIRAQFTQPLSGEYWISRTRDNMPDYVQNQWWEDQLPLMAARMRDIVDQEVIDAGGRVADSAAAGLPWFGEDGGYLLPPGGAGDGLWPSDARAANPLLRLTARCANNRVIAEGGTATAFCSVSCAPAPGYGSGAVSQIANGYEHDFAGLEDPGTRRGMFSTQGCGLAPGTVLTLGVAYDRAVEVERVRFIEGDHFAETPITGGWFDSLSLELRIDGAWTGATFTLSEPLDAARPFQIIDLVLPSAVSASGIRISGAASGSGSEGFVTCLELDALTPDSPSPPPVGPGSYDLNQDGRVDIEDLIDWVAAPIDLNGDDAADVHDAELLRDAVRWGEAGQMGR